MTPKLLLISLFISGVFCSCSLDNKSEQNNDMEKLKHSEKKILVKAQVINPKTFTRQILSNGTVNAQRKAKLVFNVNENIEKILVKNGQRVQAEDVLLLLNNFKLKLSYNEAKNHLQKAQIDLRDILLAYNPNYSDTSDIPLQVLNTAKGRSGYNDAIIALQKAKYNLSQTKIKAPFGGIISDIQAKEQNNSKDYKFFAYLIDNSRMDIEFSVLESELDLISTNGMVIVKPYAFPQKQFEGKISEINPSVDEHGMIKVKASVYNPNYDLIDGMNVEVLVKKEVSEQLVVPKQTVLLRQNKKVVFTLKNDSVANWVYVKTTYENSENFAISEGLNKGDTVIVSNNFNLGHEVVVKAQIIDG
ncbi:MAG: efflux RND transporter periplasmic adaptor subunit [Bacteroidales bacterium]|nr:efflux RND transporter periplasmic adaptor subunit [Bacteroidales bacterium]